MRRFHIQLEPNHLLDPVWDSLADQAMPPCPACSGIVDLMNCGPHPHNGIALTGLCSTPVSWHDGEPCMTEVYMQILPELIGIGIPFIEGHRNGI